MTPDTARQNPEAEGINPHIENARRMIESGAYDLLSVDVFDTLLWRSSPYPSDMFSTVGVSWTQKAKNPLLTYTFGAARKRAEQSARERQMWKSGVQEVTIEDIYENFPRTLYTDDQGQPPSVEAFVKEELAVEKQNCHVSEPIAGLIDFARARGMKIALASDTYLSPDHLRRLIEPVTADYILCSSEHGFAKVFGMLKAMPEMTGVPANRILHIGDSEAADGEGARMAGIAFAATPHGTDEINNMLLFESFNSETTGDMEPGTAGVDYGLSRIRRVLSQRSDIEGNFFRNYGATVLGPILTSFLGWVNQRINELEVDDAFFLLREGRLFKDIVEHFNPSYRCHEAGASRYVAIKAAIHDDDPDRLLKFLQRPTPITCEKAFRQLGLSDSRISKYEHDLAAPLVGNDTLHKAMAFLLQPNILAHVLSETHRLRTGMMAHFNSLAPLNKLKRVIIVDLGYAGTFQKHFQTILRAEGITVPVHGLYMATTHQISELQCAGGFAEGYVTSNGMPQRVIRSFFRSPEIIEQSSMCEQGSVEDFTTDGDLVLGELTTPPHQLEQIRDIQTGILAFTKGWTTQNPAIPERHNEPSLLNRVRLILRRSVERPTIQEARQLGAWVHDQNLGGSAIQTLADAKPLAGTLPFLSAQQVANLNRWTLHWPYGLATMLGEAFAAKVRMALAGKTDYLLLESRIEDTCIFLWDEGAGLDAERSVQETYRLNDMGTALVSLEATLNHGAQSIAFRLCKEGCLVKIGFLQIQTNTMNQVWHG